MIRRSFKAMINHGSSMIFRTFIITSMICFSSAHSLLNAQANPEVNQSSLFKIYSDEYGKSLDKYQGKVLKALKEGFKDFNALEELWNALQIKKIPTNAADPKIKEILQNAKLNQLKPEDGNNFKAYTELEFKSFLQAADEKLAKRDTPPPGDPVTPTGVSTTATDFQMPEKFDILADSTLKGKYTAALSRHFFPKGKPTKTDDFDKILSRDKDDAATEIVSYASDAIEGELLRNPAFKKYLADSKLKSEELMEKFKLHNQPLLEKLAKEIVDHNGDVVPDFDSIARLIWHRDGDKFVTTLKAALQAENDKANKNKDTEVAQESKDDRTDRLVLFAKKYTLDKYPLASSIDEFSLARLTHYAGNIASPLVKGDRIGTGGNDDQTVDTAEIDPFETSVKDVVRKFYRDMGGFGNILGVFGLKGHLAGIIVDALVQKLDRKLSDKERAKAHSWAAQMEQEFGVGSVAPPTTSQPVMPSNPYPQWPVTMPYYPGHTGHWFNHHRPPVYVTPGAGGYMIVPR